MLFPPRQPLTLRWTGPVSRAPPADDLVLLHQEVWDRLVEELQTLLSRPSASEILRYAAQRAELRECGEHTLIFDFTPEPSSQEPGPLLMPHWFDGALHRCWEDLARIVATHGYALEGARPRLEDLQQVQLTQPVLETRRRYWLVQRARGGPWLHGAAQSVEPSDLTEEELRWAQQVLWKQPPGCDCELCELFRKRKSAWTTHAELLELVRQAPEDRKTWAVLQDWLLEQGDPRGELAVAPPSEVPALLAALAPRWFHRLGYLHPHRVDGSTVWLPTFASDPPNTGVALRFDRGHVLSLTLAGASSSTRGDRTVEGHGMVLMVSRFLAGPVGQLLFEVDLSAAWDRGMRQELPLRLAEAGLPSLLRFRAQFLEESVLLQLCASAPRLEELTLARWLPEEGLRHAALRKLTLQDYLRPDDLRGLAASHLPALRELVLLVVPPREEEEEEAPDSGDFAQLCAREFGSLRKVTFWSLPSRVLHVPSLLEAVWLPRLEELEILRTPVSASAALALAAGAPALRHLRKLRLSANELEPRSRQVLQQALGPALELESSSWRDPEA